MPTGLLIVLMFVAVVAMIFLAVVQRHITIYIQCLVAGCPVRLIELVGADLRRSNLNTIAHSRIRLHKHGIRMRFLDLEKHQIAGGRVLRLTSAMIASIENKLGLTWDELAEMDLAGEDPLDAVRHILGKDA